MAQVEGSLKIRRPSQYRRHTRNSRSRKWRPRDEEGMTFNQSQAWGIEEESRRALERVSGASLRRASNEAMSIDLDSARWISTREKPSVQK